jgi:hypothetical protein
VALGEAPPKEEDRVGVPLALGMEEGEGVRDAERKALGEALAVPVAPTGSAREGEGVAEARGGEGEGGGGFDGGFFGEDVDGSGSEAGGMGWDHTSASGAALEGAADADDTP